MSNDASSDHEPMEPQYFRLKRWIRIIQMVSGSLVIAVGSANIVGGAWPIGVLFLLFGVYAIGQVVFAVVIATEEGLHVRFNIPKAKFHAWEDIAYAPDTRVLMIRKTDDTMVHVPPYLEDLGELRSMIDDTVGPPPAAQSLRRKKK